MKRRITDDEIRNLFNASRDGTANDGMIRYWCQIALAERVVPDDMHQSKQRYPYEDERNSARRQLLEIINARKV